MAISRTSSRGRISRTSRSLSDLEQLEALAQQTEQKTGIAAPARNIAFSALDKATRILSVGNAITAGFTRGLINPEKNVMEGIAEGLRENLSFSDVIRDDLGIKAESRGNKVQVAAIGFAADILFDPITYLTFGVGAGLKIGGQTLTKTGTKLAQRSMSEITEATTERLVKQGIERQAAQRIASRRATSLTNELVQRAFGKKGVTDEAAKKFLDEGIKANSLLTLKTLGPELVDRGGAKLFGKTLISSKFAKATPFGKAAARLGETEIAIALKNSLSKTFIADFGKNPELVKAIEQASRTNQRAINGIVKANVGLFKDLSDDQMSELFEAIWQKKLRVVGEEGAKRTAAKATLRTERLLFDDTAVQTVSDRLFEGTDAIVGRFAKAAGVSDEEAIKFYIPSVFQDKLTVKNFATGRNLSSPNMGWKKLFTGVRSEDLVTDPFEAYSRGQASIVTARIKTRAFQTVANSLGRPIKSVSRKRAAELGLVEVGRKGIDGKRTSAWFPKEVAEELNKFLEPKNNLINELAQATGFDWATGMFKGYVTSLFPAFHIRNIVSNHFQNMVKFGVNINNPALQARAAYIATGKNLGMEFTTKTGRVMTLRHIHDEVLKKTDIFQQGRFGDFNQFLDTARDQFSRRSIPNISPFSRTNVFLEGGRAVGQKPEAQAKLVGILSSVMEGKTIDEGIKLADEAIFNYSKLTTIEKDIFRRIIPFYTFARKNAEFQMRALTKTPGRVAAELKGIRGFGEAIGDPITEDDIEGLPDYILENLGIKAGVNQYGQSQYLIGLGLPIEEFLQRFSGDKGFVWDSISNVLAQSNPLIKFPLEKATGVDFFRNRPITEITKADDLKGLIDVMPGPVAEEFKSFIGFQEIPNKAVYADGKIVARRTKYVANPFALHFLRNLPSSRAQGTAGFIDSDEESNMNKALRFFSGVRGFSIDTEQQRIYKDLDRKRELEDWLTQIGVVKKFTTVYEPSNGSSSKISR